MTRVFIFILSFFLTAHAFAQSQILRQFAYASVGCTTVGGAPLLVFDTSSHWQMCNTGNAACATPGAGVFPSTNFWVRAVSVYYINQTTNSNWAVVGHSGINGDWVSPPIVGAATGGNTLIINYGPDAAPLFTNFVGSGFEYFDFHVQNCTDTQFAIISYWYAPAP